MRPLVAEDFRFSKKEFVSIKLASKEIKLTSVDVFAAPYISGVRTWLLKVKPKIAEIDVQCQSFLLFLSARQSRTPSPRSSGEESRALGLSMNLGESDWLLIQKGM